MNIISVLKLLNITLKGKKGKHSVLIKFRDILKKINFIIKKNIN